MTARELLAHLTHLTLVGYEDGQYQWIGSDEEWREVSKQVYEL